MARRNSPRSSLGSYNVELRDQDGFIGDRASFRAFRAMLEEWREKLRQVGDDDPLGEEASTDISKKKLDKLLLEGDPEGSRRGPCERSRNSPTSSPRWCGGSFG